MTGRWRRLEQRPDIGATFAADGADEIRLDVRQPHMVGPGVGADLDAMAAPMVAAIDQHIADAGGAQSPKVILAGVMASGTRRFAN